MHLFLRMMFRKITTLILKYTLMARMKIKTNNYFIKLLILKNYQLIISYKKFHQALQVNNNPLRINQ